ncbi:hypothetical protein GF357_05110 [Candidatus Dojkabacteria bacterium]|nr:hypothetical protein [Candidatus Dojkabacteria bacterium]
MTFESENNENYLNIDDTGVADDHKLSLTTEDLKDESKNLEDIESSKETQDKAIEATSNKKRKRRKTKSKSTPKKDFKEDTVEENYPTQDPYPAIQQNTPQAVSRYHKNSDWNWILRAYYQNPDKPNFTKYGYVVDIKRKSGGLTILEWNGKALEIYD